MAVAFPRQIAFAAIFLGILGVATHSRVVDNGYVFDAVLLVQANPHVRADANVVEIFSSPYWNADFADLDRLHDELHPQNQAGMTS